MTKEAIIDNLGTWDDGGDRFPRSEVEKAMKSWAKQQAMDYLDYSLKIIFRNIPFPEDNTLREQSYSQFIEQQTKGHD